MMWRLVVFAETEEAHDKAWINLCKEFKAFPGDPPDPMICRTHTDIHSQLQSLITQQPWQQSIKRSSF
jgi:hypothetical protein